MKKQSHSQVSILSTSLIVIILVATTAFHSNIQNALGQVNPEPSAAANANLTTADFDATINNLIAARQGIMINDSVSAYDAINAAGASLFLTGSSTTGGNESMRKELAKQFTPVQSSLDNTREALRDLNNTQALRSLNSADIRMLSITEELPQVENSDEAEEEG